MIRSMTGFGGSSFDVGGVGFSVEMRSVNHRYLDVNVRLPRLLSTFEQEVRTRVQAGCDRGKVDVSISTPGGAGVPSEVEVDQVTAREYLEAAESLHREHGVAGSLDVATLLSLPGVARAVDRELPRDALERSLFEAVDEAAAAMNAMRSTEGAALARELQGRLETVQGLVDRIEGDSSGVQQTARERLRKRAEQLRQETGLLDEARLHQEIVIAADRLDVTEELVRLRSHAEQFATLLDEGSPGAPVGRRLDFLLQEMSRETNTIGSKGSNASIAHSVVELKSELERLREQVQNVE